MKRILIIFSCCGLFFIFLVYSGIFRGNKNPISVAKFYYECMKNWEWYLAVPIYQEKDFSYSKELSDYVGERLFELSDIRLKVIDENNEQVVVSVTGTYKDKRFLKGKVFLGKKGEQLLITGVYYE